MLEAACALTPRLDNVESAYSEQDLEAAAKRFRGGIGLQELLLEVAWVNGYTGRNFRDSREVLRLAFAATALNPFLRACRAAVREHGYDTTIRAVDLLRIGHQAAMSAQMGDVL